MFCSFSSLCSCLPRVSGDRPEFAALGGIVVGSAPRERGSTRHVHIPHRLVCVCPA